MSEEIVGYRSAYATAKNKRGENMLIAGTLVVELIDKIEESKQKAKADKLALIDEILDALEEAPIPSSVFISDVCAGVLDIKQRIEDE